MIEDERGVTVLVVDDQPAMREVVRFVVEATGGMTVVGEACTGEGALREAERLRPRLVVLDVRMPGMDGVEAARGIMRVLPGTAVVLLSADGLDERRAGAFAFIPKQQLCPATLCEVWRVVGSD